MFYYLQKNKEAEGKVVTPTSSNSGKLPVAVQLENENAMMTQVNEGVCYKTMMIIII